MNNFSKSSSKIALPGLIIWGLLYCVILNAQFSSQKSSEPFYQIKGLGNMSFQKLASEEDEAFNENNHEKLETIIDFHILKAKKEGDSIEIARAYYYKTIIEAEELALRYADSIIFITRNSDHSSYPTIGYILKGGILYDHSKYENALKAYLTAYELSIEKGNIENQISSSIAVAAIRNINGQPHAAANLYSSTLRLLKEHTDLPYYEVDYLNLLYNLSLAHTRLNQLDSARYYQKKGLEYSIKTNNLDHQLDFNIQGAELDYYEGNLKSSKDTLLKFVSQFEGNEKINKLYYLAKIAQKQSEEFQAIEYFSEIDSLLEQLGEPFSEIKDVYQQLIIHYNKQNDQEKEILYLEKLIFYDSVMVSDYQLISHQAQLAYDIPYLKHQRETAENRLQSKKRWNFYLSLLSALSLLVIVILFFRNRNMNKKMDELIKNPTIRTIKPSPKKMTHIDSVPEEIRNDILSRLELFEVSDRFLDKELTMPILAKEFGTNSKYLSAIVNHYKKSFPKYLKELRINKAAYRLTFDTSLLIHDATGIAEKFGFKSRDSFSTAFNDQMGFYPTKLVKKLRQLQRSGNL